MNPTLTLAVGQAGGLLTARCEGQLRCLSSSVLGGGLGTVRTFANLQVPPGYARLDSEAHLREATAHLAGPIVGMMTAAPVARFQDVGHGTARVVATTGLGHPTAAAGTRPGHQPVGTINLFVVLAVPLTAAGLVGAVQTAVEAKAQALAAAGIPAHDVVSPWPSGSGLVVPATGTASDALAVACPVASAPGEAVAFAGPATGHGADLAHAVYQAVRLGILRSVPG